MKAGTKVFDIRYGWGVTYDRFSDKFFTIGVDFKGFKVYYKVNGESGDGHKWLSQTEYSLETGGFTAIDSLKVGDMVYVWDNEDIDNWLVYGKVSSLDSKLTFPFKIGVGSWGYASKEIPQWFIDKNI